MRNLAALLTSLIFSLCIIPSGHAAQMWTKDNLATLFASVLPNHPITFNDLAQMPTTSKAGEAMKQKVLDEQFSKLSGGDTVWGISSPELIGTIMVAGTPENIHTINFLFTAKNISPDTLEASLSKHAAIFAKLMPDWPQAQTWPNESLHRAWTISLAQMEATEKPTPDQHLIAATHGDISITTMGLVPKFAIFRLTKRPECALNPFDKNVFGRWVC